mgnify:CR=1 FL=1
MIDELCVGRFCARVYKGIPVSGSNLLVLTWIWDSTDEKGLWIYFEEPEDLMEKLNNLKEFIDKLVEEVKKRYGSRRQKR